MKFALSALASILLFSACQKDVAVKEEIVNVDAVSTNALTPLPCHTLAFTSDYPNEPGKMAPFSFTKTLYSDSRVKTIHMVSRNVPSYQSYTGQTVELDGTFTYGPNRAYLKGYSRVYTYYHYSDGTLRKLTSTQFVNLKFYFTAQGFCTRVTDFSVMAGTPENREPLILEVGYYFDHPYQIADIFRPETFGVQGLFYVPTYDQLGNLLSMNPTHNPLLPNITYTYDYNHPRGNKNYSFIPSQNWISQEFSLLEVMQWIPQPNHERKNVSVAFYPCPTCTNPPQKVVQSQVYKNYVFDSNGNQTSVSYGDNVLQKTTWSCNN